LEQYASRPLTTYCEAFFGSGAVCFNLLGRAGTTIRTVSINDIDPGVFSIWWMVVNQPDELKRLVYAFKPSRKAFVQFKDELTSSQKFSIPELALRKLAAHQMSFSGLGTMAGGAMSRVDSRWSPGWIAKNIDQTRLLLTKRRVSITNLDYKILLSKFNETACVYLDPPFFGKGGILYQYSFSERDHNELHDLLKRAKFRWVLSYDDHPTIRRMYEGYEVRELVVSYSINGVTSKKELLISPKPEEFFSAANCNGFYVVAAFYFPIETIGERRFSFDRLSSESHQVQFLPEVLLTLDLAHSADAVSDGADVRLSWLKGCRSRFSLFHE
jgi:DNA adenine methylase